LQFNRNTVKPSSQAREAGNAGCSARWNAATADTDDSDQRVRTLPQGSRLR